MLGQSFEVRVEPALPRLGGTVARLRRRAEAALSGQADELALMGLALRTPLLQFLQEGLAEGVVEGLVHPDAGLVELGLGLLPPGELLFPDTEALHDALAGVATAELQEGLVATEGESAGSAQDRVDHAVVREACELREQCRAPGHELLELALAGLLVALQLGELALPRLRRADLLRAHLLHFLPDLLALALDRVEGVEQSGHRGQGVLGRAEERGGVRAHLVGLVLQRGGQPVGDAFRGRVHVAAGRQGELVEPRDPLARFLRTEALGDAREDRALLLRVGRAQVHLLARRRARRAGSGSLDQRDEQACKHAEHSRSSSRRAVYRGLAALVAWPYTRAPMHPAAGRT